MFEVLAIKAFVGNAMNLLGKVPREVWYALAALVAWWLFSSHYIEQGREEVLTELRKAEAEAAKKALEAVTQADEGRAERAEAEAEVVGGMIERIEEAEAAGENPLDALF